MDSNKKEKKKKEKNKREKVKKQKNKAVYTAALVADGWAGAENLEKNSFVTDQRTDGPTDRPKSGL